MQTTLIHMNFDSTTIEEALVAFEKYNYESHIRDGRLICYVKYTEKGGVK